MASGSQEFERIDKDNNLAPWRQIGEMDRMLEDVQ